MRKRLLDVDYRVAEEEEERMYIAYIFLDICDNRDNLSIILWGLGIVEVDQYRVYL